MWRIFVTLLLAAFQIFPYAPSRSVGAQSHLSGNFGVALINQSSLGSIAVSYYEVFLSNNGGGGIFNATKVNF
jgi:hypothetical protein